MMKMTDQIKRIVDGFLQNASLSTYLQGTAVSGGDVKITDKTTIPSELLEGPHKSEITTADDVYLLRKHGGGKYYVLEVVHHG